jgi:hypothetical protein
LPVEEDVLYTENSRMCSEAGGKVQEAPAKVITTEKKESKMKVVCFSVRMFLPIQSRKRRVALLRLLAYQPHPVKKRKSAEGSFID